MVNSGRGIDEMTMEKEYVNPGDTGIACYCLVT